MDVRELIEELSKLDGDLEAIRHCGCEITGVDEIERIEYKGVYPASVKRKVKYVVVETSSCWCGAE